MTKRRPALSGLRCKRHQGTPPTAPPQSGRKQAEVFSAIADPQGCAFAFRTKRKSLRDGAKASKSSSSGAAILRPSENFRAPCSHRRGHTMISMSLPGLRPNNFELAASLAHEITQPIAIARNNARAVHNTQPPDPGEDREARACVVGDAGDIVDRIRERI